MKNTETVSQRCRRGLLILWNEKKEFLVLRVLKIKVNRLLLGQFCENVNQSKNRKSASSIRREDSVLYMQPADIQTDEETAKA